MIGRQAVILVLLTAWLVQPGRADEADLLGAIKAVSKQGAGSPEARTAWKSLVARGPAVLPRVLEAMDTADTVVANWLHTAFDRIVEIELKKGGKDIDTDALYRVVRDARWQGRVRRLALEVVEQLWPGTRERLLDGWMNDPEFRFDAIAQRLDALEKDRAAPKDRVIAGFREAFAASRDVDQGRRAAARLKTLGVEVSVAEHLGFLSDWYAIGPFDAKGMKGFATVYPPEKKVDLKEELEGKDGKRLRWKRYRVAETPGGRFPILVSMREPLGDAEDAVAYAYTSIRLDAACAVEFRGAADDNFTVWVNGEREFGFKEYRNGVRLDRHRFRVPLRAGVNTVLVKVCQAPLEPSSPEPNWEFLLRVTDETGKGISFKSALPDR